MKLPRLLIISVCMFVVASAANAQQWVVDRVVGPAHYTLNIAVEDDDLGHEEMLLVASQVSEQDWIKLRPGTTVPNAAWIKTGDTGRLQLRRNEEIIQFKPKTMASILTWERDGTTLTYVEQTMGSLLLDVETRETNHTMVGTPLLAALVKGTRFTVQFDNGQATLRVEHGIVEAIDVTRGERVDVKGRQRVQISTLDTDSMAVKGPGPKDLVTKIAAPSTAGTGHQASPWVDAQYNTSPAVHDGKEHTVETTADMQESIADVPGMENKPSEAAAVHPVISQPRSVLENQGTELLTPANQGALARSIMSYVGQSRLLGHPELLMEKRPTASINDLQTHDPVGSDANGGESSEAGLTGNVDTDHVANPQAVLAGRLGNSEANQETEDSPGASGIEGYPELVSPSVPGDGGDFVTPRPSPPSLESKRQDTTFEEQQVEPQDERQVEFEAKELAMMLLEELDKWRADQIRLDTPIVTNADRTQENYSDRKNLLKMVRREIALANPSAFTGGIKGIEDGIFQVIDSHQVRAWLKSTEIVSLIKGDDDLMEFLFKPARREYTKGPRIFDTGTIEDALLGFLFENPNIGFGWSEGVSFLDPVRSESDIVAPIPVPNSALLLLSALCALRVSRLASNGQSRNGLSGVKPKVRR